MVLILECECGVPSCVVVVATGNTNNSVGDPGPRVIAYRSHFLETRVNRPRSIY